jgi:flagellar FliJ protein
MSNLHSLRLAIELATRQRDALAKAHAQALSHVDYAKSQLLHLSTYAADTDIRWTGGSAFALSAEMIKHQYQFMDRLQQAIEMQNGVINNLNAQAGASHQALLRSEFRLLGLKQVLKAREAGLDLQQKRREQTETDEFAAQRFFRATVENTQGVGR